MFEHVGAASATTRGLVGAAASATWRQLGAASAPAGGFVCTAAASTWRQLGAASATTRRFFRAATPTTAVAVGAMRSRLRKPLISGFILLALVTQLTQNLGVGYIGASTVAAGPLAVFASSLDQIRAGVGNFGFYTSTNTYWRMFSPVHRSNWWWDVIATDANGAQRSLPAPDARASSTNSLLLDFREAKLLLNLWTRPHMQAAYLDHRCTEEARAGRRPASIRLDLNWTEILPPETAAATGAHRGQLVNKQQIATRTCR